MAGTKKLLITLGDPSGIGPEVVVKLLARLGPNSPVEPVIIGEKEILEETSAALGAKAVFCAEDAPRPGAFKVRSMGLVRTGDYEAGRLSAMCGNAAYHYFT